MSLLAKENILLNQQIINKLEAIKLTGELLVKQGYVEESYIHEMLKREELATTFMGNYLAIPHGTDEGKSSILQSGLSIVQVPDGVDFGQGNIVKLLIGIAGKNNEHLDLLSQIAIVCSEVENVEKLVHAQTEEEIMNLLNGVN
ncbi:PTS sugar transporter subunit IIA [Bacillus sp. 03113]|uniref:PTS sugar transporter subunit IIA n=1 Tax=Bacillus sp. 03113 TaxID=2578211 RepID=UPI001141ECF1|nr:PTS sugar transporter subunit IIA [Bacillus sp. 03113]